jgi:hypothetical protein
MLKCEKQLYVLAKLENTDSSVGRSETLLGSVQLGQKQYGLKGIKSYII